MEIPLNKKTFELRPGGGKRVSKPQRFQEKDPKMICTCCVQGTVGKATWPWSTSPPPTGFTDLQCGPCGPCFFSINSLKHGLVGLSMDPSTPVLDLVHKIITVGFLFHCRSEF